MLNYMKDQRVVLFYILLSLLSILESVAQEKKTTAINFEAEIDHIFSEYNDPNKPGAAVAVVKNGSIVFKKAYGSANLEYEIPNTPSTIFPVASVSKQFTVFSILLLADQGKLSLDDDIRNFIPEVPDFGEKISLRHLASHTSGLREEGELLAIAGLRYGDLITREQILDLVSHQKALNFKPGEEHLYCNTGFTLLAEVVARVSKQSFAAFTQSQIFDPLGMSHTLFYDDFEKVVKNRAYSYWSDGGEYKKGILNTSRVGPTGLFTTVEDLSLWSLNFSNPKVGNSQIISQMNTLATLNNGKTFGGAYGQYISTYKGLHQIYHGGSSAAGYRAYLGRFPNQDFAVIVLSNYEATDPNSLSMQVVELYLKDHMELTVTDPKEAAASYEKIKAEDLQAFVGYYWDEQRFTSSKIYLEKDTLMWAIGGGNGSPLAFNGKNSFQRLNGRTDLQLRFDRDDKTKRMIIAIDDLEPIICKNYIPTSYSTEDLAQFTGSFYSEELNTSYTFLMKDGELLAEHPKVGDIRLTAVQKDMFSGNQSFFTNVKFLRDESKSITGMYLSTFQVRNLFFEKRER